MKKLFIYFVILLCAFRVMESDVSAACSSPLPIGSYWHFVDGIGDCSGVVGTDIKTLFYAYNYDDANSEFPNSGTESFFTCLLYGGVYYWQTNSDWANPGIIGCPVYGPSDEVVQILAYDNDLTTADNSVQFAIFGTDVFSMGFDFDYITDGIPDGMGGNSVVPVQSIPRVTITDCSWTGPPYEFDLSWQEPSHYSYGVGSNHTEYFWGYRVYFAETWYHDTPPTSNETGWTPVDNGTDYVPRGTGGATVQLNNYPSKDAIWFALSIVGQGGDNSKSPVPTQFETRFVGQCSKHQLNSTEFDALVALYTCTDGDYWHDNYHWLGGDPCENNWYGVSCDPTGTSVLALRLDYNGLYGWIPPELGNCSNLTYLNLSSNNFGYTFIPNSIGNPTNLVHLNLSQNYFNSTLPSELGNLQNLEVLRLEDNSLWGNIQTILVNLINLIELRLYGNYFFGSIPSEIENCHNLFFLDLSNNKIEGSIPSELGNLTALNVLLLNSNQIVGDIPSELLNLTNLSNDYSDFRWNALHTDNDTLRTFLNSKQIDNDWEGTQTIAPEGLVAEIATSTSAQLEWIPIFYASDSGWYKIYYSEISGGPYTYYDQTANKSTSSMLVEGLQPNTPYFFIIQTVTDSHNDNQNAVYSELSMEVCSHSVPTVGMLGLLVLLFLISLMMVITQEFRSNNRIVRGDFIHL